MEAAAFIEKLRFQLSQDLPGEFAQFKMAPVGRAKLSKDSKRLETAKLSAVMILLFEHRSVLNLLLIERPEYNGVHSGQVAFPGGRYEEMDKTTLKTALRETREEIGVDDSGIEYLGSLTPLYIPPSNFLVHPFVGYYAGNPQLKADAREVKQILTVPLAKLLDPEIKKEKLIFNQTLGAKVKTPYFEIEGLTVWGATAMMISELTEVVASIIS